MVAWYKHDIPAWMDGTEDLENGPYRIYHVVCQLIYLNEGPIALNERGLAGRCCQRIDRFRIHLKKLIDLGKLSVVDGKLTNERCSSELGQIETNRANAGKGGRAPRRKVSDGSPHAHDDLNDTSTTPQRHLNDSSPTSHGPVSDGKLLKYNDADEATLQCDQSLRLEKTREEKKESRVPALVFESDWPKDFRETFWQLFPKRVDKQAAFKKLEQIRRGGKIPWATLIGGVGRYAENVRGKDQTFTKGPAAWLNAGKWDDELIAAPAFDVRKHMV